MIWSRWEHQKWQRHYAFQWSAFNTDEMQMNQLISGVLPVPPISLFNYSIKVDIKKKKKEKEKSWENVKGISISCSKCSKIQITAELVLQEKKLQTLQMYLSKNLVNNKSEEFLPRILPNQSTVPEHTSTGDTVQNPTIPLKWENNLNKY